jgi:esterase/lipase
MLYFVHGLNGSPQDWDKFTRFFKKKGFDCEAVNLKEGLNLRKIHLVDFVEKIKERVLEEDIVIGHSMGGLIMQKVVEQKQLRAGIGICPAPPKGIFLENVSWIRQIRYFPFIIAGIPFKPSVGLVKTIFLNGCNEQVQRQIYTRLQKQSAHVTYEVMKQKIVVNEKKIATPLYFIGRENDVTIPISVVKKIADKYDAPYDIVKGNHYIFNDWTEIAEKIFTFLKHNILNQ